MLYMQDVAALEGDVDVAALHHLPRMSDKSGKLFCLYMAVKALDVK